MKRPKLLRASALSHFSPSLLTKSGGPSKPSPPAAGFRGAASGTPREGRPMERGQRFTPPPPDLTSPCLTEVAPQPEGTDAPGPAACSPHGAGPTPNPSGGAPAPTHPGAGVGGCRVGTWSNRRGSSAPRTSWLQKARLRPSYLRRSKPRAPRPAPRARGEAAAGNRGPRRRRAPSSAGKRPAASARATPRRRSLARSLPRSVR